MMDYGFCFRPERGRADCSGFLHLWMTDSRDRTCLVSTPYEVRRDEWCPIVGLIVEDAFAVPFASPFISPARRLVLAEYRRRMARDLHLVGRIVDELELAGRRISAAHIAGVFRREQLRELQFEALIEQMSAENMSAEVAAEKGSARVAAGKVSTQAAAEKESAEKAAVGVGV
jgi:hypothetical protein